MSKQITVVAIAEARPGCEAQVEAAIAACVPPSRAEASNDGYVPHRDEANPSRFVFVERWASREALAEHEKTPHFQAMAKSFAPLLAKPLEVMILDPIDQEAV